LSSAGIFRTWGKGSLGADARTFWCKKTSDFSKFLVCPHGQGRGGGVSQCGYFVDKERGGKFFAILSFMYGPLSKPLAVAVQRASAMR